MSCSDQKQTIQRNLESIIIEIPKILDRLSGSMDDKIGWKEFKFFFKFSTNQVVSILRDEKFNRYFIICFLLYLSSLNVRVVSFTSCWRSEPHWRISFITCVL